MDSTSSLRALDGVWRASELGGTMSSTVSSGHAPLDAVLPGQGWPRGQLTEVLQDQAGLHEWRLLKAALPAGLRATPTVTSAFPAGSSVIWIGAPHRVNVPALACHGLPVQAGVAVDVTPSAERLWAAEQALRCRDVAMLLLWAPQVRPEQLRRLQVTAQSLAAHRLPPLVFVFRPAAAMHESSPAPLRIRLQLAGSEQNKSGQLAVHLVKRRGPPLAEPVLLDADWPPALRTRHAQPRELTDHLQHFAHVVDSPDPLVRSAGLRSRPALVA